MYNRVGHMCSNVHKSRVYSPNAYFKSVAVAFLLTIETCFNCFGIHSSNAREIIKRRKNRPGKFTQPLSTPPPLLGGEGGVDKMLIMK